MVRLRGQKYSCYDTETNRFVDYTGENTMDEGFSQCRIQNNGEIWLIDKEKGCKIIRFNGQQFSCLRKSYAEAPKPERPQIPQALAHLTGYESSTDNRGNTLLFTDDGDIWHINAQNGHISHLENIFGSELRRLNGKPRYGIVTDKDGVIWVSTYGNGLFAYEPKTGEMTHFLIVGNNTSMPIQTNYLLGIFEDRAGNIWVSQENMGVSRISKQSVYTEIIPFAESYIQEHINSIHLLTRIGNQIYVGNHYNGLKTADGLLHGLQPVNSLNDDVVAVCQDWQGTIWMGTRQSGVYVGGKQYLHNPSDSTTLSKGKISDIICDAKGRIWISVFDAGLDMAEPDGKGGYRFRHFFTGKQAAAHPRQMLLDHAGYLWLTSDAGLFVFQPDRLMADPKAYTRLHVNQDSPESDEIHCIYEDSRHGVVVGTVGRGVGVFDNRKPGQAKLVHTFTTESGLPHNNIQQIIEDDNGFVWVGTDQGLARYDTHEERTISLLPAGTLQGNMFVENAVCRLTDGRLAFGSRQGIVVIDPRTVNISKPLFQLRITDLVINGVSAQYLDEELANKLNGREPISLGYNENSLSIHFSDFEYTEGITTRYTYWLKGYDKEWSVLSTDNTAEYKNLPPGKYTFEVKAQNSDGEWNEMVVSLPITIRPPFWNTWWAYLIYILILGAILWTIYRYWHRVNELRNRIKVEQQLTEYKMQFFTNISHEFRTPLTIIRGAMERIRANSDMPSSLKQPVFSMQKSTDRLMRMVNQLMDFSKVHENKLHLAVEETEAVAFVRNIYSTFRDMATTKHISYLFTTNVQKLNTLIDRSFVDKICYNLISNAFKYTPSHHDITVRLKSSDDQQLVLVVEDTGIGIPKEKQKDLFTRFNQSVFARDSIGIGLHLTGELVRVHHGTIQFEENPKGGCIFTVSLPMNKEAYAKDEFMESDNQIAIEESENQQNGTEEEYREMPPIPINKRNILIVEDDSDVRNYLENELQHYFVIESANDGAEALEKIAQEKPELIVTDAVMPQMDGFELIRQVRANKEWSDIPIILLTALNSEEDVLKGIKTGADAHIQKPFSPSILITRICKMLEQLDKLKITYAKEVVGNVSAPEILTEESDRKLREQIDTWLYAHLNDTQLTVDSFAETFGYGRTRFFKKIKKLTGMTPNDYIRTTRLNVAVEMMKDDRMTIAEIAYKVGFVDQYYFSKSFKQHFGVSPSKYRKGESESTEKE